MCALRGRQAHLLPSDTNWRHTVRLTYSGKTYFVETETELLVLLVALRAWPFAA